MTKLKLIAVAVAFSIAPLTGANAASNGISALIQVTQLKSQFANEEALEGADKQRDLVSQQKLAEEKRRQESEQKRCGKRCR